jgi:hypothetical protein
LPVVELERKHSLNTSTRRKPFLGVRSASAWFTLFSIILANFSALAILTQPTQAAANSTINFQAKIVQKTTGLNVVNGSPACVAAGADTCDFRVSIYTEASGGTLLWQETHSNVEVGNSGGLFNLSLNSVCNSWSTPSGSCSGSGFSWGSDSTMYLQLEFSPAGDGSFTETFSRKLMSSVPYAFYADSAGSVNGFTENNFVQLTPGTTPQTVSPTANNTPLIYLNETGSGQPDLISLGTSGAGNRLVVTNQGYIQAVNGSASNPTYSFIGDTDTGIYANGSDNLFFTTGGTSRMTIDEDGNVAIGTSPSAIRFEALGNAFNGSGGAGRFITTDIATVNGTYDTRTISAEAILSLTGGTVNSGSLTSLRAYVSVNNTSNGSISNVYGINSEIAGSNSATSTTIDNAYAIYVKTGNNNITIGNSYGIYIDTIAGTNRYGIYQSGNEANRLGGDLAIDGGDLTTAATTFNLLNTNATTINFGGAANTLNLAGGSASTGCTINSAGDLTCTGTVTGTNSFTGLTLAGSTGTPEAIASGDTITVAGTGNITTAVAGTDTVTVSIVDNPTFATSVTSPLYTGSGAVTLSSGGSANLTLDAAGNLVLADATISLSNTTTTLTANTASTDFLALNNSSSGSLNLTLTDGGLYTGGTAAGNQRLTNGGALQNITGYSQSSGNFAISGTGTFSTGTGTVSLNGATTVSSTLAVNGASISTTQTSFDLINTNATTLNVGGAATTLNLAGGSASTGCTINSAGDLACTGNITGTNLANIWTDGTGITYLTDANEDLALGGSTSSSPFYFDVSANTLRIGDGASDTNDPSLIFYASDGADSGILSYEDNDSFLFSDGSVQITLSSSTAGESGFEVNYTKTQQSASEEYGTVLSATYDAASTTQSSLDSVRGVVAVEAGSVTNGYVFHSISNITTGAEITSLKHFYARGSFGAGNLGSQYGLYVADLNAVNPSTTNYAVYTLGAAPSYFGGDITVDGGDIHSGTGTFNIAANTTTLNLAGGSASTGCTINSSGDLTCTGSVNATNTGIWTNDSLVTYLTDTNENLAVGATSTTAPFSVTVATNVVRIGDGTDDANDPTLTFYASDALDSGSLSYLDTDGFYFSGGSVLIGASSESITNTSFTLDGNDAYIAGSLGVDSVIYTDSSVNIGNALNLSSTSIAQTGSSLTISTVSSGGIILDAAGTTSSVTINDGTVIARGATTINSEITALNVNSFTQTISSGFTNARFNQFGIPTLSGAATVTNAATVYIAGAPSTSNGATITNNYALWVASGDVTRLDGNLSMQGGDITTTNGTFNLINTSATTINFGGAANSLNMAGGSGSTGCTINTTGDMYCTGNFYSPHGTGGAVHLGPPIAGQSYTGNTTAININENNGFVTPHFVQFWRGGSEVFRIENDSNMHLVGGGWLRSYGAAGWYSQSYQGGIYMTDTSYVQVYGISKSFLASSGGIIAGDHGYQTNTIGLLMGGRTVVGYTPTGANWNSTGSNLVLHSADYSTIAFHDSGTSVNFIRVGGTEIQLGYNGGWGAANTTIVGANLTMSNANPAIEFTNYTTFWRPYNGVGAVVMRLNGLLRLDDISGTAGGTSLCRNGTNAVVSCNASLLKYKENVENLPVGLDAIKGLRPVKFNWKPEHGGVTDIGFIAEEVAGVSELLSSHDSEGNLEGVNYLKIGVLAIQGIKEQQVQIEQLQADVAALKAAAGSTSPTTTTDSTSSSTNTSATTSSTASSTTSAPTAEPTTTEATMPGTINTENAILSGYLKVNGHVTFGNDTVGQATIAAGETTVTVTFASPYSAAPIVNVTPLEFVTGAYKVAEVTATGFKVVVQEPQATNIKFNWMVFAKQ